MKRSRPATEIQRVAEIRADVAQSILHQSEPMNRRHGHTKKVSSMIGFLIMSTCGRREQHLDTCQSS
jgi:hypothetical protein